MTYAKRLKLELGLLLAAAILALATLMLGAVPTAHAADLVIYGDGFKLTLLETPCTSPEVQMMLLMNGQDPQAYKGATVEAVKDDRVTGAACYTPNDKFSIFVLDEFGNMGNVQLPTGV